jgi:monoamine oxidase
MNGGMPFGFAPFPPAPLTRKGPGRRIAVLGAGLSGLCAADLLATAGHEVVVLEGSGRAGGRVLTLRQGFSTGLHADAGAAFVMGGHPLTVGYAREFGLELDPLPVSPGVEVDFLNGILVKNSGSADVDWPVQLGSGEQGKTSLALEIQYLGEAISQVMTFDPRDPSWPPPALAVLDGMTFADLLASKGASPGAISILRRGFPDFWGDGVSAVSALLVLRDDAFMAALAKESGAAPAGHPASRRYRAFADRARAAGAGPNDPVTPLGVYRIRHGTDRLIAGFAQRLGARIRFDAPVAAIRQDERGVEIQCGNGVGSLTADRVIVTLACSALKSIPITPPLGADQAAAITALPYTSVTRVFLEFSSRYWRALGCNGTANTDLPEGRPTNDQGVWIEDATATQATERGILDCYFTGPEARAVAAMTEAERVRFALAQVEQVFPGAAGHFSGHAVSKCWDDDPWTRGDYCWFRPGQMRSICPTIAKPAGRIHFAGDHTSALPGWMQGALESGVRAATEVNAAE